MTCPRLAAPSLAALALAGALAPALATAQTKPPASLVPPGLTSPALPAPAGALAIPFAFYPSSGEQGTLVNLVGDGLGTATEVRFGGQPAAIVATSPRSVSVVVPTIPHEPATVEVVLAGKTWRSPRPFQVTQLPIGSKGPACSATGRSPGASLEVASVTPLEGLPGTNVAITGSNLDRVTEVSMGGLLLDQVSGTKEKLVVRLPPSPPTTGHLVLKGTGQALVTCQPVSILKPGPSQVVRLTREQPATSGAIPPKGVRVELDFPPMVDLEISVRRKVGSGTDVRSSYIYVFSPGGGRGRQVAFHYRAEDTKLFELVTANAWGPSGVPWVVKILTDDWQPFEDGQYTIRAVFHEPGAAHPAPPTGPVQVKQ